MSLQVWLPLQGDLHNQGLSGNTTLTAYGEPTVDSAGKIGSCYTLDGTNDYFQFSNLNIDGLSELSLCFWCYSTNGNLGGIFLVRQNGSNHILNITSTGLSFRDSKHSSLVSLTFEQPTANTWTHYSIVYNKGSWRVYKNGIEKLNQSYATANLNSSLTEVRIGRAQSSGGNVYFAGKLNDFRIYNHALSPKEVEEIAKGLVLHYKLDNNGMGGENLAANTSTMKTLAPTGTATYCSPTNFYRQTTDGLAILHNATTSDIFTVSFDYVVTGADTSFNIAPSLKRTSSSFGSPTWVSRQNATIPVGDSSGHFIGVMHPTAEQITYGEGWLISVGSNNRNISILISNFKFEQGSKATAWSPAPSDTEYPASYKTTVYDSSGYSHNGTIVGSLTAATPSPRYDVATQFPGNALIEAEPLPAETKTISAWIKWNALPSGSGSSTYTMQLHDKNSGLAIGVYNGGTALISYVGTAAGGTGSKVSCSITTNTWYHIVVVKTGDTTRDVYINNVKQSPTTNNYWGGDMAKFHIGGRHVSGSYSAYLDGQIADVRAYTTALTPQQIKELYTTSMSIDASGNVYARELVEL